MNRSRQSPDERERGGYSTSFSVTQHLVPQEEVFTVFPSGTRIGDGLLFDPADPESRSRRRKSFWARLKKPKGEASHFDKEVYTIPNNTAPRRATVGAKLIWDSDQQLWLFANEQDSPAYARESRPNERRGASILASLKPSSKSTHTEEDLLFAQLPGHYALSSIYNCANYEQTLPAYDPVEHADDVGRRTSPDGQWMLVAKRLGQSTSTG